MVTNCQLTSAHSSVRVKVYPLSWYCRLPPSTDLGHVWAWMKLSSLIGTVLQYANGVFLITNACWLQKDFVVSTNLITSCRKLSNLILEIFQALLATTFFFFFFFVVNNRSQQLTDWNCLSNCSSAVLLLSSLQCNTSPELPFISSDTFHQLFMAPWRPLFAMQV